MAMGMGPGFGAGMARRYGGADKSAIEGKEIDWKLVREVLRLARPYRNNIILFAIGTFFGSALVAAPPLVFRQVIDSAMPRQDLRLLAKLSLTAMGLILLRAILNLVARWQSAALGNGMVFQLRR